jgi:4,5-dihydroxyphthalate decarboxylase
MADVPITIASGEYDRIRAIKEGRVTVEGCAVSYHVVEPNQLFVRNLRHQEFDVSEMSFSTYIALCAAGRAHYVAIPVFLSRAFRHSAIFVRSDRGITSPRNLIGKRVGTAEYFTTMQVWMRGLLADEYGITPSDLRWRVGPLEQMAQTAAASPAAQVGERVAGVEIEPIAAGKSLASMLADGEIDALFSARPPSPFLRGDPRVARLFPDYRPVEQAYYRKTGIFPLMHAVGIRNSLAERHPWMARRLYEAFSKAKAVALADFEKLAAFAVTLPWIEAEYRATQAVLGQDIWPYGIAPNRTSIEALCRYLKMQGFTDRTMSVDELFAPLDG